MNGYAWYRSLGRCVRCHKAPADDGYVMCTYCRAHLRDCRAERRKMPTEQQRQRKREYENAKTASRKAAGICISCGSRPAAPGHVRCEYCMAAAKQAQDRMREKRGQTPRFLFDDGYHCHLCGRELPESAVGKRKLCASCLKKTRGALQVANSTPRAKNSFEETNRIYWAVPNARKAAHQRGDREK